MKKQLLIFMMLICFTKIINAQQQYIQGDIQADFNIQLFHDSSACATYTNSFLLVTVSNSFVGDTLKVKDFFNYLISTEVNLTGQNPWIINLPLMYLGNQGFPTPDGTMIDYYNNNNMVSIQTIAYKFINGQDSIDEAWGVGTIYVPDLCSYSTISGVTYADYNSNCVFDVTDGTFSNYQVDVYNNYNPGYNPFGGYTIVNNNFGWSGSYNIILQESFLTNSIVKYSNAMLPFAYPNSCTPGIYSFNTLPQTGFDFALQCTSNIDIFTFAGPSGPVRPGIPFNLWGHVGNLGCDTVSGWLKIVLDPRVTLDTALSGTPPTQMLGDTLYWTHGPISNISNNGFWNGVNKYLHLTPDTTVNIGDTLCFYAETNVPTADIYAGNNSHTFCVPVVNSYDPNVKEVSPKGIGATGIIPPTQEELEYTVYFQNTGTASAINVKIVDTLDVNIIPQSLIILGRSHTLTPEWIAPGVVRFNFNNINLPDSNTNEFASHGFVKFKVKLDGTLPLGTEVKNTANIYFDFNAPIITNTTLNTVDILTDTRLQSIPKNVSVFPNPAKDQLSININNFKSDGDSYFELYNISGQLMLHKNINSGVTKIDVSEFGKGLYLLKVFVAGEQSISKIMID